MARETRADAGTTPKQAMSLLDERGSEGHRRIDIVVLTKKAQRAIEGEQGVEEGAAPVPGEAPADAASEPLAPEQLQQRLNIFEDGALQLDQLNTQ